MRYDVKVDADRNRLYVVLAGLFSEEEARTAADAIIVGIEKLRPGFDVVNDMSAFRPLAAESLNHLKRVGEAIVRCKGRRVIRVLGVSAVAAMQIQRSSKEAGYEGLSVASLEEAEALLAKG